MTLLVLAGLGLAPASIPASAQKFDATWESLEQYECPQWFRDAKFGVFICWNAYTVPAAGDWYARNMYIEGHRQYNYHCEHFGHPSKFGYKDIIRLWKGENFDADKLVALFQEAGAKYIVPMAMHHDNFDLWNSKYHRWNSVNMGPKIDIVGAWRKATRKRGLRFGVTTHLARSYSWFQTSHGADKKGPYAGVPYDGNDPKYWDLYHPPFPDHGSAYPRNPPEKWKREWFNRLRDLLDQHHPDLFYFDGGIPFGRVGRELVAYYYNENQKWHDGKLEAVMNIKNISDARHGQYLEGVAVLDMERGVQRDVRPQPWQTDTSIGDWFWTKGDRYKSTATIIHTLADIVSKNGNLLLNVPPRADGTLDDRAEEMLHQIGAWLRVNGEAIYGTRPWKTYGEGPTRTARAANFNERWQPFTPNDIRFTRKANALYAIVLGWPGAGKTVTIRSLADTETSVRIGKVTLLGRAGELKWSRDSDGLYIQLPEQPPCDYAVTLKIGLAGQ